jgi:hypothetical protein
MLGVVLMPRWLGERYVDGLRRHGRGYWVNFIPTRRWLRRTFDSHGVRLTHQPPEGLEKLGTPDQIRRHKNVRRLARVFAALGLTRLLRRIAISQEATHTFIGRKETADGTLCRAPSI